MNRKAGMTVEEAFEAGFSEPCDHGTPPSDCPRCRLTDAEIGRLVVLLRGALTPQQRDARTAA
ncbi:hypothetical protein [Streptomyces scabiei]|uniref:Uncharacterized protein n=1 Tax=Streptomyces scabiei TaxID=1930 RepID=A0A100JLW5_STRSC|nr:hypothetical protein [Streptomyces scabiei]GAQ61930.1 hypothetical protein SsS58_02284 [Streptomyces scabiei]